MQVLLVEDDPAIADALVDGLPLFGFAVRHVTTAAQALAGHADVDLVLLDLGLPDLDGIEVCRRIRAVSEVPIIIITARGDEVERVVGLELGADDFLVKPFGLRELVARARAVLRRWQRPGAESDGTAAPGPAPTPPGGPATAATTPATPASGSAPPTDGARETRTVGGLRLHLGGRRVWVGEQEVELTPKEFDLLVVLSEEPGVVCTREDLMSRVWDPHWFGSTRTLDVHIGSLRRKIAAAAQVQTVRGVGFRLEAAPA
ncbi:response regulator transcription factor [Nocardioides sp.]|uniref:response regulator transcription factor n=1 Tax=Nocardioides sp. TaxID=35761 RepID=UPI003514A144